MAAAFEVLLALSGVSSAGVAIALLANARAHRPTQVFAFYLLLGALATLLVWGTLVVDPALARQGSAAAVYFALPAPLLLVAFALRYPVPRGRWGRSRTALPLLALGALALDAAYLVDHGLYNGPLRLEAPLTWVRFAAPALIASVALLLARDVALRRAPAHDSTLVVLAVMIPLSTLYTATRTLTYVALGLNATFSLSLTLALLPAAASAYVLARHAVRSQGEARTWARRGLAGALAGPAAGLGVGLLIFAWPGIEPVIAGIPASLVALAAPLLTGYALLRLRLFDIDLRLKRSLPDGAVTLGVVGVFTLGMETGRGLLGAGAPLAGFAAASLLLVAVPRLRRGGRSLAERALPGVRDDPTYLNVRRIEVYRAALEEAHARPGGPDDTSRARLADLRAQFGLTDRDHALLEVAVLGGGGRGPGAPQPGERLLGRYLLERRLGEGASGTTFLARDEDDGGRAVAVKALRPERSGNPDVLREARAMQRVAHPHVVRMLDVAEDRGGALLVMEYVDGGSLADRLTAGPLRPGEFRRVALDLLDALGAVHDAGALHRDLKPSNVLLTSSGRAKLADFGVAYVPGLETTLGGDRNLAHAVGTIRFMSPEQARGRRTTERSDLFSAAATLYEACTGQAYLAPLPGESSVELQLRAAAGVAFPKDFPGPAPLRAWFARALHPAQEKRFPRAGAMRAALEKALDRAG